MCFGVAGLASPRQPASSPKVLITVDRTRSSFWPELNVLETTLDEAVDFVRLHSARHWTTLRTPHDVTTHKPEPLTAGGVVLKMTEIYPSLTQCAVVATAFKVLLFPA